MTEVHAISFWLLRWLVHLALSLLRVLDRMDQVGEARGVAQVISAGSPHIFLRNSLRGQTLIMCRIVCPILRLDQDRVSFNTAPIAVEAQSFLAEIRGGRFLAHLDECTLQLVRSITLIVQNVLARIGKRIVSGY